MRAFLDALGDEGVARVFEYKLLSGQPGASPLWQMLQHVVNHASYHRGQVTTMLRQLGAAPAKSDGHDRLLSRAGCREGVGAKGRGPRAEGRGQRAGGS